MAFSLGNTSECLSLISSIDFDAPRPEVSSSLPNPSQNTASSKAHPVSLSERGARDVTGATIETVLSRTGSIAASVGGSKKLEGETKLDVVWWTLERIRARCEQGPPSLLLTSVLVPYSNK